jgi:hypothetical protein
LLGPPVSARPPAGGGPPPRQGPQEHPGLLVPLPFERVSRIAQSFIGLLAPAGTEGPDQLVAGLGTPGARPGSPGGSPPLLLGFETPIGNGLRAGAAPLRSGRPTPTDGPGGLTPHLRVVDTLPHHRPVARIGPLVATLGPGGIARVDAILAQPARPPSAEAAPLLRTRHVATPVVDLRAPPGVAAAVATGAACPGPPDRSPTPGAVAPGAAGPRAGAPRPATGRAGTAATAAAGSVAVTGPARATVPLT